MLKKKLFLFAIFLLLVFALLSFQSMKGQSRFADFPFHPLRMLEQASSAVTNKIDNIINTYVMVIGKEAENKRLLRTIEGHEAELNRFRELEYENERLRKILKLKSRTLSLVDIMMANPSGRSDICILNGLMKRDKDAQECFTIIKPIRMKI